MLNALVPKYADISCDGLIKQAERMLRRSRVINVPASIGDNVTIPIPLVDRGRGDPRNLMGVVLEHNENDLYRIAVRNGILAGVYSRNQFHLCPQKLLTDADIITTTVIFLRTAVQRQSVCGGQSLNATLQVVTGARQTSANATKQVSSTTVAVTVKSLAQTRID